MLISADTHTGVGQDDIHDIKDDDDDDDDDDSAMDFLMGMSHNPVHRRSIWMGGLLMRRQRIWMRLEINKWRVWCLIVNHTSTTFDGGFQTLVNSCYPPTSTRH